MLLSIDVGLRNLSMCIMSCEESKDLKDAKIHLWEVFNTLSSEEECRTCSSLQKNGKICGKKCGYKYLNSEGENVMTCKTHFPKEIKIIPKIHQVKTKKVNEYLLQDIAKTVISKLNEIYENNPLFKNLQNIIIELQPKINQKMKFTSHIIYGKLVELYLHTPCIIRFVRANQKLKAYTGEEIVCNLKGDYARRKWLSIQYTKWFLENQFSPEEKLHWLPHLDTHHKRDDLCDTFLMCVNGLIGVPKKTTGNVKRKHV